MSSDSKEIDQKEIVEELKFEWKRLWQERVDDHVRAEGIAAQDYSPLFVEKGTIVHATRAFRPISFEDILEKHKINKPERFVAANPLVGGWGKFIKTSITNKRPLTNKRARAYREEIKEKQQPKKGGRGWLHR
jgi:hypothetical protein